MRSTQLLPENVSLSTTLKVGKLIEKGSPREKARQDNLEKNKKTLGNTVIARNAVTRSLAPPPCSR